MLSVLVALSFFGCALQPAGHSPPVNACDSVMIERVRGAVELASSAVARHAGRRESPLSLTYEGTITVEAHMMRPGMVRTTPITVGLVVDPGAGNLTLTETRGQAGATSMKTTIARAGRVAVQSGADAPFTELLGADAKAAIASAQWWSPITLARAMAAAAPSCRRDQAVTLDGAELTPLTFVDGAGRSCTAFLDADHRIVRVERLFASQWLGDACDWTRFDFATDADAAAPRTITRFSVLDDVTVRHELTLRSAPSQAPADAPGALPAERRADLPNWGSPTDPPLQFVALATGVTSIEDTDADVRIVVVERTTDLVVLGAPCGDLVSSRFIRAIRERFPNKTIGQVAFGHHHPAASGGLRAWAAAGAEIVTPRELEAHVREQLTRPTTLGGPALAGPGEPKIRLFDDRTSIECPDATIELIDIKERSSHAFHYIVFHLKGPGILFEDDLGYFPTSKAASAGPRLIGLSESLAEANVTPPPRRLVQLWPVKGVVREVAWSDVMELVEAAKAKNKPK